MKQLWVKIQAERARIRTEWDMIEVVKKEQADEQARLLAGVARLQIAEAKMKKGM